MAGGQKARWAAEYTVLSLMLSSASLNDFMYNPYKNDNIPGIFSPFDSEKSASSIVLKMLMVENYMRTSLESLAISTKYDDTER